MTPLTPEQQAFAEEHHGLILDFMEKHSLDGDCQLNYTQIGCQVASGPADPGNKKIPDLLTQQRPLGFVQRQQIRMTMDILQNIHR